MGRNKNKHQQKKKLTRLEKTKQAHPDNFGPRYYKHDEFTTKKRLIIDFCKDYILITLFGFLALLHVGFFESEEYEYLLSKIFGPSDDE